MDNPLQFEIWVELDHEVDPSGGVDSEYCNAIIEFSNGTQVGVIIWSKAFFDHCNEQLNWIDDDVATLPDLVVREFNCKAIKNVLTRLVTDENWLVGRGLPSEE